MKTIFLNHPATPQEATQFAQHLLQKFPLSQTNQISIEFLPDLLKALGHEYCHALQHDQDRDACCVEADEFGWRESKKYLNLTEKRNSGSKRAA